MTKPATADIRSPFEVFETDPELEKKGIKVDYDDFWFYLARAGGSNEAFGTKLSEVTAPFKRAIETDSITPLLGRKLTRQAFCETILLGWGSKAFGEGQMVSREKTALPFSVPNADAFFEALPDLMQDLLQTAQKGNLFRKVAAEAAAKN